MSYVILKTLLLAFFENKMGANWLNLLCEPTSTPFFSPLKNTVNSGSTLFMVGALAH